MEQLLIGRREAAEALGICLRQLDYMIERGELPVRRIGRRVLIPRAALEQFVRRDRVVRLLKAVPPPGVEAHAPKS